MKLRLKEMQIKGFKPYKDVKVVCFSENTLIEADNGEGKSSIGDAICFAFLGTGADGVEKAGAKLLNKDSKDMYVTIVFEVDGEEHILSRSRKGTKNELILDTNSVEQVDLMNFVGRKELFLTIFNPVYFTGLTPKEQKEMLQKYLGDVSFEDVIAAMGNEGQDLLDDCFMVPQLYLDRKREELKEIDGRENYLKGFMAGKTEIYIPDKEVFEGKEELIVLKKEVEELKAKPKYIRDISKQLNANQEINSKISELSGKKITLESKVIVIKEDEELREKGNKKAKLLSDYKNLKSQLEMIKIVVCPTCNTQIESTPGIKQKIQDDMEQITTQGKVLAAEIMSLEEVAKVKRVEQEKLIKDSIKLIDNEVIALKEQIVDVESMQTENAKYLNELVAETSKAKDMISKLENKQLEVVKANELRNELLVRLAKDKEDIRKAQEELSTFDALRMQLNQDIERAKKFSGMKLKMQGEYIGKFLDKVTIKFQKIVKSTGELKDDFKLEYEDKDFNLLSTSERIKAGLEISTLLSKFTDISYPVFIDNGESITAVPELDTQVIVTKVKEGEVLR